MQIGHRYAILDPAAATLAVKQQVVCRKAKASCKRRKPIGMHVTFEGVIVKVGCGIA
jgi:hypothetical protein